MTIAFTILDSHRSINILDSGNVYSWGEGEDGKLGHGNRVNYDRPKLIEALSGIGVIDIACGSAHSAVITSSGHVMTFGKGRYGRLGHGDSEDQLRPKLVEALLQYRCVDIACGSGDAQTLCITGKQFETFFCQKIRSGDIFFFLLKMTTTYGVLATEIMVNWEGVDQTAAKFQ